MVNILLEPYSNISTFWIFINILLQEEVPKKDFYKFLMLSEQILGKSFGIGLFNEDIGIFINLCLV